MSSQLLLRCLNWLLGSGVKESDLDRPDPFGLCSTITRADYIRVLSDKGIKAMSLDTPLDDWYSVVSKKQLDVIAPYLVYPADNYLSEVSDCEDYAIRAQSDAAFNFHVSSVRLCLGDTPLGYHGFVVAVDTERNLWLLESNAGFEYAGEWFRIGLYGYVPEKVLL